MDGVVVVLAALPLLPRALALLLRIGEEVAHDGTRGSNEWTAWEKLRERRYARHLRNTRREVLGATFSIAVFLTWMILADVPKPTNWWIGAVAVCVVILTMLLRSALRPTIKHPML